MNEHTKGPWAHEPDYNSCYADPQWGNAYSGTIKSGDNMVLAVVIDDKVPGKANARLIAAAPELLEELKGAVFHLEHIARQHDLTAGGMKVLRQSRKIISKATNESPH